jgi:hypothetical protein
VGDFLEKSQANGNDSLVSRVLEHGRVENRVVVDVRRLGVYRSTAQRVLQA